MRERERTVTMMSKRYFACNVLFYLFIIRSTFQRSFFLTLIVLCFSTWGLRLPSVFPPSPNPHLVAAEALGRKGC